MLLFYKKCKYIEINNMARTIKKLISELTSLRNACRYPKLSHSHPPGFS